MRRVLSSLLLQPVLLLAQAAPGGLAPLPDDRLKADVLVVVAHPDDEFTLFPYLARAIHDEKRRVAVVFTTPGDGGGNGIASEHAVALGAVRQVEARQALASFGIHNVWFLDNKDIPTQNVLSTLGSWRHGESVERLVRLMRLTRPDVVITWLPAVVAGENHGGHQAAGVIATEAYDLAGDPTAFPAQVARPVHPYEGELEGLRPWQAKKLYFATDASHLGFAVARGPRYRAADISPSQGLPYATFVLREWSYHRTQGGDEGRDLLAKGLTDMPADWRDEDLGTTDLLLILGKSRVKAEATADVLSGVSANAVPFAPHRGFMAPSTSALQAGGPWAFYRDFGRAHDLERLDSLLAPEYAVSSGTPFHLPVLLGNDSDSTRAFQLSVALPEGWSEERGAGRRTLRPHEQVTATSVISTPHVKTAEWREVRYELRIEGQLAGALTVRIHLRPHEGAESFEQ